MICYHQVDLWPAQSMRNENLNCEKQKTNKIMLQPLVDGNKIEFLKKKLFLPCGLKTTLRVNEIENYLVI